MAGNRLIRRRIQTHEQGLVLGHCSSGRNLSLIGRFAPSRSHLDEALALYDSISHRALVREAGVDPQVLSQAFLGIVLLCLGYPEQALAQSDAAIAEARGWAHPPSLASAFAIGAWSPNPSLCRRSNIMNHRERADIGDGEILFRPADDARECAAT
jgi:hypothetical protein